MFRFKLLGMAVLTLGIVGSLAIAVANEDDKPAYTVKQVMKMAHGGKDSLIAKLKAGTATKTDKEKMVELYDAMAKNKNTKGEEKVWKEKTEAIVAAAKDSLAGKEGADAKLIKAADCKGCHSIFK